MRRAVVLCLALLMLQPATAQCGLRVSPMRIDLDASSGSGAVSLVNAGPESMMFQVSAMGWTQDETGQDRYAPTQELVFFPKVFKMDRDAKQVIRVGTKAPAAARERSYRLFIEQVKPPVKAEGVVTIALRVGIPVFGPPARGRIGGELADLEVSRGEVRLVVRNGGNASFRIDELQARGTDREGREIFSQNVGGWHLLAGASRAYAVPIPGEICPLLAEVSVRMVSEQLSLEQAAEVGAGDCLR